MENAYTAALLTISGIGQERVRSLIRYFNGARHAWQADRRDLFLSGCLPAAAIEELLEKRSKVEPMALADTWQKRGISIVARTDTSYPALLQRIYNPPELLFYKGMLPTHEQLLAIVGTRRASAYGKNVAKSLSLALVDSGFWVVSGAAWGIDSAAHLGAMESGKTIAVLGCGVDINYPPENAKLLCQVSASGAVLSEYPPGTPPNPRLFPARNRIISGLSRGVIVIEAGEKSGALITADFALEQNRDVFAVPGNIFSQQSRGCHNLIKQGAKLVDCATDILEEYQIEYSCKKEDPQLTPAELAVYGTLSPDSSVTVEEIVLRTNLAAADVSYILLQFVLQGIAHADGQRYLRSAWEGNR